MSLPVSPAGDVVDNGLVISFGREDVEEGYQVLTESCGPRGQVIPQASRP